MLFVLLFGPGASFFFVAVWEGGEGGGVVFFVFAVWAGGDFFFAVWAGGVFFFLLSGRGSGVHSLTGLPGSSLSDPTTKKQTTKKTTRIPLYIGYVGVM